MAKKTVELEHKGYVPVPVLGPKKPDPEINGWLIAAAIIAALVLLGQCS